MAKISESGHIRNDGKLLLPMDRVNAFLAANKGKRVVVEFVADEPGSTAAQQSYYYKYVLPTIVAALREQGTRKTEKQTDRWLMGEYPGERDERILGLGTDVTEARQMDQRQMADFLDWLKQFAAENLYVYIEDPKNI